MPLTAFAGLVAFFFYFLLSFFINAFISFSYALSLAKVISSLQIGQALFFLIHSPMHYSW